MGISLSFYPALAIDIIIWSTWSVAAGWWASRLSDEAVAADGWLTRLRPWEREGQAYGRLGIRRWKSWLPDLGVIFGGRPKSLRRPRDPAEWQALAGETRRAERVHWLILAALPVEALLRGGTLLVLMAGYAVVANVPCIVAQRYNRGRLLALRRRRAGRSLTPRRVLERHAPN
jgi:glycosyl-4,4'-diaponeurosporenoate acyltransferase